MKTTQSFLIVVAALAIFSNVQCHAQDLPGTAKTWADIFPYFNPPAQYKNDFGHYRSPLQFADGTPVRTPADWPRRCD